MFASFFRLRESCAGCGLVLRREQGAMTGQMYLSAAVTELLAALVCLAVFFLTDWSAGASIAICLPLIVGFSYWFLPRAMSLWVAVEYVTDRGNDESWARGPVTDPSDGADGAPREGGSSSERVRSTPT